MDVPDKPILVLMSGGFVLDLGMDKDMKLTPLEVPKKYDLLVMVWYRVPMWKGHMYIWSSNEIKCKYNVPNMGIMRVT